MYHYPAQEPVYPSHSGTRRKPHAFEPINPFAPRRQRTLPVDSVRDVDEIPLPPQRHLYHQQAGQSPNARPEFTSHSTTHHPNILHSAPARVRYAFPSDYRAPQPSHGTPSRPLGIPSEVLNRYPLPQVIAHSRPPSSLSEVQSRPPSSPSEVQSRPPSSQSQVPNSSPPPSTHSDVVSRPPPPQPQAPNPSRPSSTHSEHSSPTSPPVPGQDSGQQSSQGAHTVAGEAVTYPPPHSSAQPPVIQPSVAPMSFKNYFLPNGIESQSTNGSPSAVHSSSLESFEKNSSIATPSSTASGSAGNWDRHYHYHEPMGWVGGPLAQTSVKTSFNKESPLRLDKFLFIDLLRDIYYLFLLNIPRLYYSRVGRVLNEAQLSLAEMKEMSLVTSPAYKRFQEDIMETGFFNPNVRYSTPAYERLRAAWELFIDGLLQDWKALNVMTVLLLSAIVSIFQIDSAAQDPVTRYTAFASLICALMSLMYSCVFLTQFASMRQPYKAVEWAVEAQKRQASLWNVWIMLATPVVWLSWSLIAFISSIMSFMWRVGIKISDHEISTAPAHIELVCRVILTLLFCMGIVYGVLIINTLRRYGSRMDDAWERRIDGFISRTLPGNGRGRPSPPVPAPSYSPFIPPPFTSYANPAMGVPWAPAVPVIPMSPYTTPGQSFKESHQSSDALGDPNHPPKANPDMAADSDGAEWHPSLPLPHSSTIGSGQIHPVLLASKYGTHHPPDSWIKQSPGNKEKSDTSQFASIPPHAVPGSVPPPAREGVEVAMTIWPPVDDLTTTRPVSGSSDESHHQTFSSGKEKGRSRSPVPDHLHSPPVSVGDAPRASSDHIREGLSANHTSSAPEQRIKAHQTPVELSSTSIPDLPPSSASRHTSSPSSPIFVPLYENTLGLFTSAAVELPSPGSSSPPTSSSKET